ncbi:uncharacterized protein I206_103255 [Kwoniella pini CBS 10737]|uniref:Solute carrier family 32 (Vesicular inhibitory amino acid transporter) n=1 Tax=Kwoniella pini CBS 10737 TaxID=1296096 RepID=A0A1B9IA83_9TREE|nr:solute carrier family 32 (vesicular inhibitory amino acid transporter) [Kwoniella pini CBS 10737]OCF52449.1 solute carrier family 32 (vesicular inhibitory amino acid transporter) [Kwoniella pini CBS 10737]
MSGTTTPISTSASTPTLYDPADTPTERTHLLGKDKFIEPLSPIQPITSHYVVEQGEEEEESQGGEEVDIYEPGKATFAQTLLNVLGDLIGTGLLACPIAIAHAGWVLGPIFLCVICAVTLWTLKILIRIIEKDRRMRNFADVARYGLGERAEKWITGLFVGDCCIWIIALIVLFSDTMEAVWPVFSSNQWKLVGMAVIIPLNFVPLRYLSYTSFLGVLSTWALVCILIFTGLTTSSSPGSISHPAPTDLFPSHGIIKLGLSFGLLISGFGGHFLIPNLIRDMKHPKQADKVVEIAYGACMVVYVIVAVFGYLMFGRDVSDEVSRDLAKTAAFSPTMAKIAVWMVALNPLTKLPLGLRPLCDVIYTWFNLQPTIYLSKETTIREEERYVEPSPPPLTPASTTSTLIMFPPMPSSNSIGQISHDRREMLKNIFRPLVSILLICFFILGAFILPSFETVMSIMGGGLAVISCILVPIAAGSNLWGWSWYARIIFGLSCLVALISTICALLNDGTDSV